MKKTMGKTMLSWLCLMLGCLALLTAGGLLLSGCGPGKAADYQRVVDEVNDKYGVHLSADIGSARELTPEQLRAHLEAVAQRL